jgi:phosphonate transport system substrate-binding protein
MFVRLRAAALSLTLALVAGFATVVHAEPQKAELLFGSVAMDIPAVMHKRLKPLADYLSSAIGRPVQLHLSPNMPTAIDEVATARVDLAYLTPVAYIRARDKGQAQLVVKTVTKGKSSFRLMVVVRDDSPIKSVRDLVGKSFAFGDKAALLQRAVVVGSGINLDEFGEYRFIGHYDNIVRGVLSGDFDAGILKDTMAYNWSGKGIRIIHSSPDLPPYNISASRNVDPATLGVIRSALLKLDAGNPDHQPVIAALDKNYDGFARTSDAEYDVVRQLIAPFITE